MKIKTIAIFYGGPSNEHEVSIKSAKNILKNIDRNKWRVIEIFIDKEENFYIKNLKDEFTKKYSKKIFNENEIMKVLKDENIYKVFPVLHGKYGEDGKIQKTLEKNKINFVGSSSKSSGIAIDKNKANKIYIKNNILIPNSKLIHKNDFYHKLNYPIIIKPIDEGSSFGLFKIDSKDDYINNIEKIFLNYENMLAQEFIFGREFTCGVIEIKNKIKSLSPSEIVLTKTKTFDYKAKYTKGAVSEITPANINKNLTYKIQNLAKKCHKILGCKDISRTDIILNEIDKKFYVLETNTLPGMTETSFIPAEAEYSKINMKKLIDILLSNI